MKKVFAIAFVLLFIGVTCIATFQVTKSTPEVVYALLSVPFTIVAIYGFESLLQANPPQV